jgi:phosphate transport system permease protein
MVTAKGSMLRKNTVRFGGDQLFEYSVMAIAALNLILVWFLAVIMFSDAWPSIDRFGIGFLVGADWDPNRDLYGALPFVFGTLVTTGIAMLIGVPLSIGIAIYLSELAPQRLKDPLSFIVELLAAVPSVIYGLWAMYALRPVMVDTVEPFFQSVLGWTPLFQGDPIGLDKFTAGVILAIMVIPTIASVSKEAMMAVPDSQREAALSIGATRYEVTRMAVLTYTRSGIFGACILGMGRAIGETMAVAMTIGNANKISWSLLDPGQTMASLIANNWGEAEGIQLSALIEIGLVLFFIALLVNVFARAVIGRFMSRIPTTGGGL